MPEQVIDYDALAKAHGAVSSQPPPGAHPEARMSAAEHPLGQPYIALPEGSLDAAGMRKVVSPAVERFMSEPLARPTGIDAIDGFLSPSSLALMAATAGPDVVRSVTGAVSHLAEQAGGAVTKKLLKLVMPSMLKKPAELADLLTEIGNSVKARNATAAPSAPAAPASPAASGPVAPAPPVEALSPPAASAPPPAAPPPTAAPAPSPGAPPPVTMGPDGLLVGRPGGNPAMPNQKALNEAALAARRAAYQERLKQALPTTAPAPAANVKLSGAETKAFLDLMQRGVPGADAMKNILAQRALLESGMVSDAERIAAQDTRYVRGEVKTPSAETARARKGKP